MRTSAPYGSWRSPITADLLVDQAVRLGSVAVCGDDVFWVEGRPSEAGRQVVVRLGADGVVADVVPEGFAVRTLVHEYGGLAYAVSGEGWMVFSNFADQRLYTVAVQGGAEPIALTPAPAAPLAVRFADPVVSPDGAWVLCVRERHLGTSAEEVHNDIVAVPAGGGDPIVLADGHDFFAAPRIAPDGASVCWLSWDHPNMPWDGTDLHVAAFADGKIVGVPRHVAGGPGESVSQPRWSPEGVLHHLSDRTGWWNLYRGHGEALAPRDAEFGGPDWVFGQSSYDFLDDGRIVAAWTERNVGRLGIIGRDGAMTEIALPYSLIESVRGFGSGIAAIAGSPTSSPAVVRIALPGGEAEILKAGRVVAVDPAYLSVPEVIEFPTEGDHRAHAFFYPPTNADFCAPGDERPPLIVMSHGGPTSSCDAVLDLGTQYWTSRGFAVVDVNYGGSSGYGRAYRDRLQGAWGVVDVDDCVNAARFLAASGRVDEQRMVIRGGSAGGYTTLAALAFRDVFAAGASHYGVADAEALAKDTHKFESRYLDGLIGPYPAAREVYVERSPIHHTDTLDRPMILFQGLEDKVVPPDQADMMAQALRTRGIPFAHVAFEGEQHGFRHAETIKRVAGAELWFYGRVLGFEPADDIEPVDLENADGLAAGRPRGRT